MTKKNTNELRANTLVNRASQQVPSFEELIHRFQRSIFILGRSPSTFKNYSMHVAAISLHFGKIPLELN